MLNPFEDDLETGEFIPKNKQINKNKEKNICQYILVGCIYMLEIFTCTLAGLNDNPTDGLAHSKLIPQYWLLPMALYNILGMIAIYQFNQRTFENKIYFIIYESIKLIWIIIGIQILFYNKLSVFIVGYMLFYIIFESIYCLINFYVLHKLKQQFYL
jgi:hypothetical protein